MKRISLLALAVISLVLTVDASSVPARARKAMVASQDELAARVGADVIAAGGNAVDAAVATAFALAVVHPTAGNIGGGGFLVFRAASGDAAAYDFREAAPAKASPTMFVKDGKYDPALHHNSHLAVGVPGTVAGLHLAWKEQGKLPWKKLVDPAIALARDGFTVTEGLARSLKGNMREFDRSTRHRVAAVLEERRAVRAGRHLKQPDLARTLERIAEQGPRASTKAKPRRPSRRKWRRMAG